MTHHHDFRAAAEAGDAAALAACLAEDVTFCSPAVFEPYRGREAAMLVLGAVSQVFEDFRYVGEFTSEGGRVVLEFRTRVGDKQLQGIDLLTFDEESGLVIDLTVMLRPLRGLQATVDAIGRHLAAAGDS